jgi:hypothetical protein
LPSAARLPWGGAPYHLNPKGVPQETEKTRRSRVRARRGEACATLSGLGCFFARYPG